MNRPNLAAVTISFLILSFNLRSVALEKRNKKDGVSFPRHFTADFTRNITSQEHPNLGLDMSYGKIMVDGNRLRFELRGPVGLKEGVFSIEVHDFDSKREITWMPPPVDDEKKYTEIAIRGLMVDHLLNVGFPLGEAKLLKGPGPIKCDTDIGYIVHPSLPPGDMKAWKELHATMYVCMSRNGTPSMSMVTTIEHDGRPWKNIVNFEHVKIGRVSAKQFQPPAGYQKAP